MNAPKDVNTPREVKTLWVAEAEAGIRLDRFIKRRWPHLNHIQLAKLCRSGQVRVDGARVKPDMRLESGQQVRIPPLPDAPGGVRDNRPVLSPQDVKYIKSLVIFEDELVIAINKPSGLAVQGGTKTLHHVDRLLSAWGEGMDRPRLVHRLDRDTSGVLLLGKTPEAAARLAGSFARRKALKTYWAVVSSNPKPADGGIDVPLVKKGINDREKVYPTTPDDPKAESAETEYVTLGRAGPRAAWMALRPHTGRTHQLRAHMLARGHPILGDPKDPNEASAELSPGLGLQLHHRSIEIPHPDGGLLKLEAEIDPVLREGFERFGFMGHDADNEPFARKSKKVR